MVNEVSDTGVAESGPAKKLKTGGRVKKSLDQLLAETRVRNEIAGMNDDTHIPEELAAIYLCTSVSELAEYRKPAMKANLNSRAARGRTKSGLAPKPEADVAKAPRLKMIKPIRQGAVGQNQKVFYKLGHLREFRDLNVVESSFEAAVNAGIYGFMTIQTPFFALLPDRSDRGLLVLIGNAWNRGSPKWENRFKDVFDEKLSVVWLTNAEAAKCLWTDLAEHKVIAQMWLAMLGKESQWVSSALEGTEIAMGMSDSSRADFEVLSPETCTRNSKNLRKI